MSTATASDPMDDNPRKRRLHLLARASVAEMEAALSSLAIEGDATFLRGPETGLVMVRARMGGTGASFNLGEATMTRATVRLASGAIGHGQRLGGDKKATRLAAVLDAAGEDPDLADEIEAFLARIQQRLATDQARRDAETAATRVDFFTMVRGDD